MERILVVDDDADICDSLVVALGHDGYQVAVATNDRLVAAIHLETPVDIVILDIFMPRQDCIETIMALRRGYPNAKIIAMSARIPAASTDCLGTAREFGADIVLAKPFSYSQLRHALSDLRPGPFQFGKATG